MRTYFPSSMQEVELPLRGKHVYIVFFCFALAYFVSYSFRSINAVITPELALDLGINNTQLGLLTSAYFIGFGLTQIPVGICLDKFGPRLTESSLMILAVIGALFFYFSKGFITLLIGRLLIGMGVSACLMSAFSGFRSWYPLERQPQLASAILIFGTSGALLTSSPARMLLPYVGWRGIFLGLASMTAIAICVIFLYTPAQKSGPAQQSYSGTSQSHPSLWNGYQSILKNHFFLRLLPIGAICLGGFMAIQTLWLGPWLIHVMGHSPSSAAQIIFWFNSALLLTYIANTILLPKFQKIGITTLHYISWMVGASIFFQFFAFFLNSSWSYFCWYLYAATSASYVLAHSLVISNFPKSFSGRVSTSFNIAIFIGASLIQWGMGAFVDLGKDIGLSKRDSFNLSFGAYLAIQLAGFIWFLISPKLLSTNQKNQ